MIQLLYKWTTGLFSGNICAQTITHERSFGIILYLPSFFAHIHAPPSLSNALQIGPKQNFFITYARKGSGGGLIFVTSSSPCKAATLSLFKKGFLLNIPEWVDQKKTPGCGVVVLTTTIPVSNGGCCGTRRITCTVVCVPRLCGVILEKKLFASLFHAFAVAAPIKHFQTYM